MSALGLGRVKTLRRRGSESREVGDARGMFRSDYALIAAMSG